MLAIKDIEIEIFFSYEQNAVRTCFARRRPSHRERSGNVCGTDRNEEYVQFGTDRHRSERLIRNAFAQHSTFRTHFSTVRLDLGYLAYAWGDSEDKKVKAKGDNETIPGEYIPDPPPRRYAKPKSLRQRELASRVNQYPGGKIRAVYDRLRYRCLSNAD